MSTRPIKPVRNAYLSLWQSSVAETIRAEERLEAVTPGDARIRAQPMMIAATAHAVQALERGAEPRATPPLATEGEEADAYVSELKFEMAEAMLAGDTRRVEALGKECRKYATCDWAGWATCMESYLKYRKLYDGEPRYTDWKSEGKDIRSFGVIEYKLPENARVALLGDWGTGTDDAEMLLADVLKTHKPDAVIHVGDIYYSGTPDECRLSFANTVENAFAKSGIPRVPVFTIPGNHEYYSFGAGYYPMLAELNPNPTWKQEASYFCLRTADDTWQFLAMDTGRHDYYPLNDMDPAYAGPWLEPSEIEWHHDKLAKANFAGKTILLSHHMLFSQHAAIGPRWAERPWLNEHLLKVFQPHFGKITSWFWGHEHNLALFEDGILGLPKGRLVGCSGYEESEGEDPYAPHNDEYARNVPYREPVVKLGKEQGYYDHGYALFDFSRASPDDPINVTYYSYPSWGQEAPMSPKSKSLASEKLGKTRRVGDAENKHECDEHGR